jgi:hypothetical protein
MAKRMREGWREFLGESSNHFHGPDFRRDRGICTKKEAAFLPLERGP